MPWKTLVAPFLVLGLACHGADEVEHDHSPARSVAPSEGMVWVGFRIGGDHGLSEDEATRVVDRLTGLVEAQEIGSWDGQSVGSGQIDASFEVDDVESASSKIRAIIIREFPDHDFWISDDYETIFDDR